jgi:hypothetical protein
LQQRVAIEAFVRNCRAQWVSMDQSKRALYHAWKITRFQHASSEEIKIRDLIMSMECSHIPHTHYACPICWHNFTVHKEASTDGMRKHCYHAHNLMAYQCHDPVTLTLRQMIGQDVMLAANVDSNGLVEKIIVRGNHQQCYYRNCRHKAQNGVGMLGHVQTAHGKHNPADMGIWDIILEHLNEDPDATITDLVGHKEGYICKRKGCGYVAVSEKAMLAHNTRQHRSEAQCARAELTIHLGKAVGKSSLSLRRVL